MLRQVEDGLGQMGIEASPSLLEMLERYREELMLWNRRTNLTAITDPPEIEVRHFLDSLTPLCVLRGWMPSLRGVSLIDVGSGAGFPGIPLKLALPEMRLTLLEATGKKAEFLRHMVDMLALPNTEVVHGRAEEVAHRPEYREGYSVAVARAVAPLATLVEVCIPFLRVGGLFIALKKGDIGGELASSVSALARVGGGEAHVVEVPLRQLPDQRRLVVCTKIAATPDAYPRRTGVPFKRPL